VTIRLAEEARDIAQLQSRRDERRSAGGQPSAAGTIGAPAGTNGARLRIPRAAYAGVALFILALTTVNALTVLHDAGPGLPAWKPFVAEYSAAVMIFALLPAVAFLAVRTPMGRGRWAPFVFVHLLGTVGFCVVLVGGFVFLRKVVYAALGRHYVFGAFGEWIYEYRKDVLAYWGMAVVFHLSARLSSGARAAPRAPTAEPEPTFDIRDGLRIIRAPVSEIISARSAGNYVEFHLADGRRPLMRATLAGVEAALAPHGFLRTHRSWLVNPQRVRALEPEGSGDWRVALEGGGEAPLSRRFPQALEALRRLA